MMTLDGRCILNTGKYCNIYIYHRHTGVGVAPSPLPLASDMSLEVCVTMRLSISMTCVCGYPWVIVQLFILIQNHHFKLDLQIDVRDKVWTIRAQYKNS